MLSQEARPTSVVLGILASSNELFYDRLCTSNIIAAGYYVHHWCTTCITAPFGVGVVYQGGLGYGQSRNGNHLFYHKQNKVMLLHKACIDYK